MRPFAELERRWITAVAMPFVAAFALACGGDPTDPENPNPTGPGNPPPGGQTPPPAGGLAIATSVLPGATVDVPYEASFEATGGTPPYLWSWGTHPPPGLILDAAGLVTGTPGFPAGTHLRRVSVLDATNTTVWKDVTLEIGSAAGLRVTSLQLGAGEAGTAYADTLEAAGGEPPYTFDWSSPTDLQGLSLEAATGALSGVPERPTGAFGEPAEALVTVHDAVGASAIARVGIGIRPRPLVINIEDLPDGEVGVDYEGFLSASGGFGNRRWTVVLGTIPPGLGVMSESLWGPRVIGTPTVAGSFTFTLRVSDSEVEAVREFTVEVAP